MTFACLKNIITESPETNYFWLTTLFWGTVFANPHLSLTASSCLISISEAFSDMLPTKTVVVGPLLSSLSLSRMAIASFLGTGGLLTTGTEGTITVGVGVMMPMWTGIIGVPATTKRREHQLETTLEIKKTRGISLIPQIWSHSKMMPLSVTCVLQQRDITYTVEQIGAYLTGSQHTEEESQEGAKAVGLNAGGRTFWMWIAPTWRKVTLAPISGLLTPNIQNSFSAHTSE